MAKFSNDVDLLKWEPVVFRELALVSQRLCEGSDGVMSGTTFTSASASFTSSGVAAGHVICLRDGAGSIDGCYEVVSVDSATQLTISVVRETLAAGAVAPPGGSNISYHISSFDPQAEEAAYGLLEYFGIKAAGSEEEITADDILNGRSLRQASVFAVLSSVFAGSACSGNDPAAYWQKSLRYQRLFQKARARARLEIDTDNDNIAEEFRIGGTVRLQRL